MTTPLAGARPASRLPLTRRIGASLTASSSARWPEAVVVAMVALALAAGVTTSGGIHRPWTTLPLAGLITWALWRAVRPAPDPVPTAARGARYVLAGTAVWIVVGLALASQFLIVMRDPGFLALSGVWLTDHPSTDIPTLGAIEAARTQANMLPDAWQAWNLEGDVVQPQGAKMLPGVLSVGGWLAGVTGVLGANVLIGGVGIIAVYVLARRMLGPLAALGPAAVLALTVSHQGLSRSPYSEPLTLVLIVAAVTWAWRGLAEGRMGALVAAGITSGATALVRIDGAAYAVGVLAGVVIVVMVRPGTSRRLALAFALPQAVLVAAGYAALAVWSASYLERLADQATLLGTAYAAAVVVALLAVALWGPRPQRAVAAWGATRARSLGRIAGVAVTAVMVAMASRPLWMTDHRGTTSETDEFTNTVVASFQQAEGYAIEPTRTYAEHTLTWASYYLTWPVLILAFVGLGVLVSRAVARDASGAVFLAAFAAPTAIYLVKPEIVPDQLWAIRRFEPITMPGLAIAAAVGAWWLAQFYVRAQGDYVRRTAAIGTAAVLVLPVLSTYVGVRPGTEHPVSAAVYAFTREQDGARAEVDQLCDLIDGRPVVLVGSSQYYGTVRVMCDVPVVLALEDPRADALAGMVEVWGRQPVVITQETTLFDTPPEPVVEATVTRGEYALQHMPLTLGVHENTWYAATVERDGSLTALVPTPS